jgi:hypothetical protein
MSVLALHFRFANDGVIGGWRNRISVFHKPGTFWAFPDAVSGLSMAADLVPAEPVNLRKVVQ